MRWWIPLAAAVMCSSGLQVARPDDAGAIEARPVRPATGVYEDHSHVITFNIRGGDGDATVGYNDAATVYNGSNTVQSRIIARWPFAYGVGLQEVCEVNYQLIVFELAAKGFTSGSGGYHSKYVQGLNDAGIGTTPPADACGHWFGNSVLLRGALASEAGNRFANQGSSSYGEKQGWVCLVNVAVVCTAHLHANATSATKLQNTEYRNIGALYSAAGYDTFMGGDFNLNPGLDTLTWVTDAWSDPDQLVGGFKATEASNTYDYIWRNDPGTWWADAVLADASWTDHKLKQGYFN